MVDYDLQKTFTVSERLRKRVAKHIMSVYGKDITVKISIGVAELAGGREIGALHGGAQDAER